MCESILLVRHKDRVFPARIGANHFELVRTPEGWQTTKRTTRGLDGSAEARELLQRVVVETTAALDRRAQHRVGRVADVAQGPFPLGNVLRQPPLQTLREA